MAREKSRCLSPANELNTLNKSNECEKLWKNIFFSQNNILYLVSNSSIRKHFFSTKSTNIYALLFFIQ